jgi:hypothetical protein
MNNTIINSNIKIINHVYKNKFKNEMENSTGLGDFIRGSYFLFDFCKKNNLKCIILFDHSIIKYLQNVDNNSKIKNEIMDGITIFKRFNILRFTIKNNIIYEPEKINVMDDFINYINEQPIYNNEIYIHTILYPFDETIPNEYKYKMKKTLEFNGYIKSKVSSLFKKNNLKNKEYIVIHIRTGDEYLNNNNTFNNDYINKLITFIRNDMNKNNNYILLADNNYIKIIVKNILLSYKLNVIIFMNSITHFNQNYSSDENLYIDFQIIAFSKRVFAYSSYEHGTGFSYWSCITNDIPYVCKFIEKKT